MKVFFRIVGAVAAAAAVAAAGIAVFAAFGDEIKEAVIMVREWLYTVKNLAVDYAGRFTGGYTREERNDFADV